MPLKFFSYSGYFWLMEAHLPFSAHCNDNDYKKPFYSLIMFVVCVWRLQWGKNLCSDCVLWWATGMSSFLCGFFFLPVIFCYSSWGIPWSLVLHYIATERLFNLLCALLCPLLVQVYLQKKQFDASFARYTAWMLVTWTVGLWGQPVVRHVRKQFSLRMRAVSAHQGRHIFLALWALGRFLPLPHRLLRLAAELCAGQALDHTQVAACTSRPALLFASLGLTFVCSVILPT